MDSEELRRIVGANIRSLCKSRGMTTPQMADFAGVNRAHAYNVLASEAAPTTDWLAKVAVVLGVEPFELLREPQ
ncbi:MAG: helix-turn-helix domain-containing protein [Nannocystaceae bacterium]|nr:helix-turn-helix domain-containing protein [bacterium]